MQLRQEPAVGSDSVGVINGGGSAGYVAGQVACVRSYQKHPCFQTCDRELLLAQPCTPKCVRPQERTAGGHAKVGELARGRALQEGTRRMRKISESQIEETDRRHGKVFDVIVWTVAADGKTITVVDTDPVHGTKTTYTTEKQP